jgi:protein XagA
VARSSVTGTASSASKAFDAGGSTQSTPRYGKTELQALMEYGVTDWLTAIAVPSLQRVSIAPPVDAQRTGFGNSEFGARARVMQESNWVLSAQGTIRVPGTFDTNNPAAIGNTGVDFDLRALYGASFAVGGLPTFVDVQVGERFRTGGPPSEARIDLTLGVRAAEQWLVLMQQFNVISEGSGAAPFTSNNYHKLQMSVVYDFTPHWSVQGGAFTTFAGRNALQENGLLGSVWYRF